MRTDAPTAAEFARLRMARHRRSRRRAAVAGAVVALVGALVVGALIAYGLGGDPERDDDGRLVPAEDVTLDAGSARALVADGTWPGGDRPEGLPREPAGRLRWLLSEVAWDAQEAEAVGLGLREAAAADDDVAVAMVAGVGAATVPLLPELRDDVVLVLRPLRAAVATTLAGEGPTDGGPAFQPGPLLATLSAVGHGSAAPLEGPLVDDMVRSWYAAYPVDGRDAPGAARRFGSGYAEQFRRSVQPVVLLYVGLAGQVCGDGADPPCRERLARWTERADRLFGDAVLDTIPRELLPPAVDRALGADRADRRPLPPVARQQWERFRAAQGYGVLGPVLDALAS